MKLARIRFGGGILEAAMEGGLHAIVEALRNFDRQIVRLSIQAYHPESDRLAAQEAVLRRSDFRIERPARDYHLTSLISLRGTEDELFGRLAYSARRGVRSSDKAGFRIAPVVDSALAPRLAQLHKAAHDRTGGGASEINFAALINSSLKQSESSVILGATHPSRDGPDALVGFLHGLTADESVVYATAGTERAPDIGSTPLAYGLIWELMRWGQRRAIPYFDFGGITPESEPQHPLAGISVFKRKFRGTDQLVAADWCIDIAPKRARALDLLSSAVSAAQRRM